MIELVLWYLVITLLGVLALPVAYRFLPFLSDRGYTLARTLGLLLWGFIFWLLASLHILQNDSGGVLIALGLLAGLSWWASGGVKGWREMLGWLKERPRLVLISEIVFLAGFIFMAMMRAANPQIAGTEKPMELAFINAILRSPSLPPADPWLSGYSISYYYFGYVMVAMLTRITGVISGVAFNLAISMIFALAAIGSYGVAYSLLASWSRRRQADGLRGIFSQGWALLAPLFILVISNLEGGFEMLHATNAFWSDNGLSQQSQFWSWLGELELNQPPSPPYSLTPNRPGGIWWWRASRVLQDYNLDAQVKQLVPSLPFSAYIVTTPPVSNPIEVIDEFPFFSYYLADLHPHVLAMPFVMLAIALALNLYLRGAQEPFERLRIREWVKRSEFWLTAVVLGGLAFLNTWDFPIYLTLFSATYTLVRFQQAGWKWGSRIKEFLGLAAAIGIPGILLYMPFYIGFSSQAGGILPSLVFFTRGVHFWMMFAVLLAPVIFWLFWMGRQQGARHKFSIGFKFAAWVVGGLWVGSYLLGILGLNLANLGGLASAGPGESVFSRLSLSLVTWGNLFQNLQGGSDPSQVVFGSLSRRVEMPGTWITLLFLLAGTWALLASFRPACRSSKGRVLQNSPPPPAPPQNRGGEPEETGSFGPLAGQNSPNLLIFSPFPSGKGVGGLGQTNSAILSKEEGEAQDALAVLPAAVPAAADEPANPNAFVLLMVLVGTGLTLAPEFVYLRDQFGTRMNTIFKLYYQSWMLWGLSAAFALALIWNELRGRLAWSARTLTSVVCLAALAYPVFGISQRLSGSPIKDWTLDGTAYIGQYDPDEKAAMEWLSKAPYGVIAEAVGGSYSAAARMATQSGLPDVLGWIGHESQWRGGAQEMGSRQDDISTLYRSRNWSDALAILKRYQIQYVVVGQLEVSTYAADPQNGVRALDEQKFKDNLKVAYQNNSVTVYEVNLFN